MSKIFDNRQLLHIVSEIVVLMALTYNISAKFKIVRSYIDDICHRLDEQEEMLTRQNQQIESLTAELKKLYTLFNSQDTKTRPNPPEPTKKVKFQEKPSPKLPLDRPPPGVATAPLEEKTEQLMMSSQQGCDVTMNSRPSLEQSILSSLTFIPMIGNTPDHFSQSNMATIEEIDSDQELDQELEQELEELKTHEECAENEDLKGGEEESNKEEDDN